MKSIEKISSNDIHVRLLGDHLEGGGWISDSFKQCVFQNFFEYAEVHRIGSLLCTHSYDDKSNDDKSN
jgi:hypothetical protein